MWCWGENNYGQLGDRTLVYKNTPTLINSCNILVVANENLEQTNFSVYPNPSTSILNIQTDVNVSIETISIFDISGKKVIEEHKNCETINLEKLHAGNYLLKIYSKQKTVNIKFIKLYK